MLAVSRNRHSLNGRDDSICALADVDVKGRLSVCSPSALAFGQDAVGDGCGGAVTLFAGGSRGEMSERGGSRG